MAMDPEEWEQVQTLCDVFDYDPQEFKYVVKDPKELSEADKMAIAIPFEDKTRDVVNQLGYGPKIVELKRKGWTIEAIADHLELDRHTIGEWWRTFTSMTPKQRQVFSEVAVKNNIFNTAEMLQNSFAEINEMSNAIKDNPELWIVYRAEIRQHLKFAADMIKSVDLEKARQEEYDVMVEEVRKESPECAIRILKRVQMLRQTRGLLGG